MPNLRRHGNMYCFTKDIKKSEKLLGEKDSKFVIVARVLRLLPTLTDCLGGKEALRPTHFS
jgi:hypothetical protein